MAAATGAAHCLQGLVRRRSPPLPSLAFHLLRRRTIGATAVRMASSDAPQLGATTVAVPGAAEPVRVVAAPGLPEPDLRKAVDSALFRRWLFLRGAQPPADPHPGGGHVRGACGIPKFKADIVDEETKAKVIRMPKMFDEA